MSKDYNSRRAPSQASHGNRNFDNRRGGSRAPNRNSSQNRNSQGRRPKKSAILLKSSVYAFGVIFLVLLGAYYYAKNNKPALLNNSLISSKCQKSKSIVITNEIEDINVYGSHVVILTKEKNDTQELIKLDRKCFSEISRQSFKIK